MQQFIIVVAFSFAVNFVLSPHSMADIDQPELQFNIPSQSLESGLVAFSLQADINIIGTTELLRQHVIPDINGYFTRTEVLAILLQGSGLCIQMFCPCEHVDLSILSQASYANDNQALTEVHQKIRFRG